MKRAVAQVTAEALSAFIRWALAKAARVSANVSRLVTSRGARATAP